MDLYEELLLYILRQEKKQDEEQETRVVAALCEKLETLSYCLLEQIREIIRDPHLDDAVCFEKIEAIVCLFAEHGMDAGSRHDFG